jgi:hypothetical protein
MVKILLSLTLIGIVALAGWTFFRSPQEMLPPPLQEKLSQQSPVCPEPFIFTLPVDISKVTSILYPGQVRGGNFKAHGGFRFDGAKPEDITVYAPYDARVIAGARYPVNGEIQYTFDFEHPCGIRYRFGHLLTLSPKFAKLAEKFPLPKELDSRTTPVSPPVEVKQGEVIATAVGLTTGGLDVYGGFNTFVDWGVYDHRNQNEASQRSDWATLHASEDQTWKQYYNSETYQHAVCWFDWLSPEDREKILSLPSSDSQSGTYSDFCK